MYALGQSEAECITFTTKSSKPDQRSQIRGITTGHGFQPMYRKNSVGRAEVRTIAVLASLAKCSLDELILRGESVEMIETGIKPLDLFAPLAKGVP